jgi:hypothetical protein
MAQMRFVTSGFLLLTLLFAVPSVLQAAPIEDRSINKSVKDFPEKTDLSSPESSMAAWCRAYARMDIEAMPDLTWVWLDPQAAGLTGETLPAGTVEKILGTKLIKVLTYRVDLAAVIEMSSLNPSDRPYRVMHFGRIDGKWKSVAVDWRNAKDLSYRSPSIEAAEERFDREKDDLWRFFKQVRDDVKNGRRASPLSAKQLEEIKRIQVEAWGINIRLDMPSLEPQAVQFAVVDKDPAPGYTAQLKKMEKFSRQQLQNADTKQWKDLVRSAQMEGAWNDGFRNVTGDNLSLLTQPGIVITSNAPVGKKWIITKTVRIKEQPVCWSIPIEVKTGKPVNVTLNKSNTFDLQTPYDDPMKEPDGSGAETESK